MKSKIVATILTLLCSFSAFAEKPAQPLIIEAPETWKVKFEGKKNMPFYTVTSKGKSSGLLMLSQWPAASTAQEIPELLDMIAESFVKQVKEMDELKLKSEKYALKELKGNTFSGNYVKFKIKGGIVQTMFMIGKGKDVWNGQFTGSEKQWIEALSIIEKVKRRGA